ncbi:hypothetical protein [Streptomyces sp. TS71-3]|uniref:hypothetical protein n=1 Tax=Streptomyces sp. TS71-3 TaxID=2733862 RepID=UPI001BB40859|nr:hypothetical protein [Streptomyces sp. TS71-3]
MKLSRAIAATATVAALAGIGPIALLATAAPVASADATAGADPAAPGTDTPPADPVDPVTTPSGQAPNDPATTSPGGTPSDPATDPGTPPPSDSPSDPPSSPPAGTPTDPATGGGPTPPGPGDSTGTGGPGQSQTTLPADPQEQGRGDTPSTPGDPADPGGTGAPAEPGTETLPGKGWSPDLCGEFVPDDGLSVDVTGLPGKIVAGSGWHPFLFTVTNHTGAELTNIYAQSFTEYATGVNEHDSLQLDLARLQFKDPATGRWTDAYQDFYQDGGGRHAYSGTFVALVPRVGRNARVDLQLRVNVAATAPPGAAFALSTAVYAGHGDTCNLNGDTYDFTVLKAGSTLAGVDDAKPTGEKPAQRRNDGSHPQGGVYARPVTGTLAATGTSEAVPIMGLIGALAVLIGSVTLYLARRRAAAQALGLTDGEYAEYAENAEDAKSADGSFGDGDAAGTGTTGTSSSTETAETAETAGTTRATAKGDTAGDGDASDESDAENGAVTAEESGAADGSGTSGAPDDADGESAAGGSGGKPGTGGKETGTAGTGSSDGPDRS